MSEVTWMVEKFCKSFPESPWRMWNIEKHVDAIKYAKIIGGHVVKCVDGYPVSIKECFEKD